MGGHHGVSRRALLAAGGVGLLAACSPSQGPAGSAPPSGRTASGAPAAAGTSTAGPSGHDVHWVTTENARPGTRAWVIQRAQVAGIDELAGYTDVISVRSGESFGLHLSSTLGDVTVTAYRVGHYGGAGGRAVWTSAALQVGPGSKPTIDDLRTVRCQWPKTTEVSTRGWPEGTYLLHLSAGGRARYVPVTVRSETSAGRLVLLGAVATHQAYNRWGGYSLYKGKDGSFGTRAHAVSFDRPYDGDGAPKFNSHEASAVRLAESLGLDLAYVTSWDLDREPDLLAGARGVVSLGHDEYWTVPMRNAVEKARDAGVNVAFLGANASYWRVRFDAAGRLVTGYKSAALDPVQGPTTTAQWRQSPDARPENSMVGMLYEAFPAQADLVVHDPSFFLFQGTGVLAGSAHPGLVETEIDRAYPIRGTPPNLQVVAHSPVAMARRPKTYSDMTYYTSPSGAGVFAVGTMGWCWALRGVGSRRGLTAASVEFVQRVTSRLFTQMAAGPMGRSHPSVGNLAAIGASPRTSTGTGGPVASS